MSKVDPKIIKKIVSECYCKYVSENKNKDLYEFIKNDERNVNGNFFIEIFNF